ncbi:hypothetical protein [Qingshengfaniella alkalisoli]|uniref:Nickel/cobalt transporter regulator n=1 Tax=Qingshengfaniella alkalisoli TaxID=2599296 RepID=A0A5B8J5Q1_9RHOB|nr:hypothetical protein [Qingshengfaniella alkalisoli]QDY69817.1 hypothetical protein FPZ52_09415 [Qingshengfaniella alkalisoli]
MRKAITLALISAMSIGVADVANAGGHKEKFDNGHPGRGWGVGGVPPGHAKKMYGRGYRLGSDDDYVIIRDLDRWRLPNPRPGEVYVRKDDEVYRMARDTATVIEAIGIVSDLLR